MEIERSITVYNRKTERLKEEINIDYIDLVELKRIFKPVDEDPLMYMAYEISEDLVQPVNELLGNKIKFDLQKNSYFVECAQLPPYDFEKQN
ncbi:DUF7683 domain-containing protein [Dyadobacter bucti]|uniref:DUF7683 domain-containing protein n=1 Tax=Dyadobacter bucti TaxID=2572203 RepID=UPI001109211F|nr:hypothetical protein [Dyadobacter bucti]